MPSDKWQYKDTIFYQKLMAIIRRNMEGGEMPRGMLETNIAREFRLCRADVRRVFKEMKLNSKIVAMAHNGKKKASMTDRRLFQETEPVVHLEGD